MSYHHRYYLYALFLILLSSVSIPAQTIVIRTDLTTGPAFPRSKDRRETTCVLTTEGKIDGKNFPVDTKCNMQLVIDPGSGTQQPMLSGIWLDGQLVPVYGDPGLLFDKNGNLLNRDDSNSQYAKDMVLGIIGLRKGTMLSFDHVHMGAAPKEAVKTGPANQATAPRTVPSGPTDPTGFDIKGIKLYMSSAEVVAALEASMGTKLTLHTFQGLKHVTDPAKTGDDVNIYVVQPDFVTPRNGLPIRIGEPYVDTLRYIEKDGSRIIVRFISETVKHDFGKPEIATEVQFYSHTAYYDPQPQNSQLLSALHKKFGEPCAQLGWMLPIERTVGVEPLRTDKMETHEQADTTQEVWCSATGEPIEQGNTLQNAGITYPYLITDKYSISNKFYPQMFELESSLRFAMLYAQEVEDKKQEILRDANPEHNKKPDF